MLVELTKDDYPFVAKMMADRLDHEKICGTAFTYPLSVEKYIDYFVTSAGDKNKRLCFKYLCDDVPVGMTSYTRIDRGNDYGHIGLVAIDPMLRGAGHGENMINEILKLGFETHQFNRIDLVVIESNTMGYQFYVNKIGFRDEGLIRDILKVKDGYLSWHSLSMIKSEWANKANQSDAFGAADL